MKIISFDDILNWNHELEKRQLGFKVHLRDACSGQSCWIEPLDEQGCEGKYEELYEILRSYFDKNGFDVQYSDDKMNFWMI